MQIKIPNIYFINLMTLLKPQVGEKQFSPHTAKLKDSIGFKKIEEGDRQFLVEKLSVEFSNPYENSTGKKTETVETVENNYRILRRVYQHLYADIADISFNILIC